MSETEPVRTAAEPSPTPLASAPREEAGASSAGAPDAGTDGVDGSPKGGAGTGDEGRGGAAAASVAAPAPRYGFLAAVAGVILVVDAVTKWWAESTLLARPAHDPSIVLIEDVLTFSLAYNKGGAFGMLASEDGFWRQPFFVAVSIGAVLFIVSLYKKLLPEQNALRWGLPLVLGGALGNLVDRIFRGKVVDFIDYRSGWVEVMNGLIAKLNSDWHVTSHWPTFNVADMAICTGIGLMALDMFMQPKVEAPKTGPGGAKPGANTEAPRAST
jgi:signal peptidase II